jgi:hypothetical protein
VIELIFYVPNYFFGTMRFYTILLLLVTQLHAHFWTYYIVMITRIISCMITGRVPESDLISYQDLCWF